MQLVGQFQLRYFFTFPELFNHGTGYILIHIQPSFRFSITMRLGLRQPTHSRETVCRAPKSPLRFLELRRTYGGEDGIRIRVRLRVKGFESSGKNRIWRDLTEDNGNCENF